MPPAKHQVTWIGLALAVSFGASVFGVGYWMGSSLVSRASFDDLDKRVQKLERAK